MVAVASGRRIAFTVLARREAAATRDSLAGFRIEVRMSARRGDVAARHPAFGVDGHPEPGSAFASFAHPSGRIVVLACHASGDRKRGVSGKWVWVRVVCGSGGCIMKKTI